jgi:cytochrome c553
MAKLGVVLCLSAMTALSAPRALKPRGLEAAGSKWNLGSAEQTQALKLRGDARRGEESFQVCAACHQADGAGQQDGLFPRLAGQHPTVIIKQLTDIRMGRRDNAIMYPFASTVGGAQEMADLTAYIATLKPSSANGRGPGKGLERGQQLYLRDCATCHGAAGEGNAARFFPRLAGQHYRYLLRQAIEVRTGARRNANPDMARVVKPYEPEDLSAVADYVSRLEGPPVEAQR